MLGTDAMDEPPPVRKLIQYHPLAAGTCDACGQPIWYNLAVPIVTHADRTLDLVCLLPHPIV